MPCISPTEREKKKLEREWLERVHHDERPSDLQAAGSKCNTTGDVFSSDMHRDVSARGIPNLEGPSGCPCMVKASAVSGGTFEKAAQVGVA